MKGVVKLEELEKVKNSKFGTVICGYYGNGKGDFFMTRQQIGQALEYDNPKDAIKDIHRRHKERLDKFSVERKLTSTDGKNYKTVLYSAKGVYEVCRWSRQPKADEFYDHVYDILEGLRLGYLKLLVERNTPLWIEQRTQGKLIRNAETDVIKKLIQYAQEQGSTHADMLYMTYSKLANKMAGISDRDLATFQQLSELSFIENIILNQIRAGMDKELHYKAIYQDCKKRLEMFKDIAYLESAYQ